MYEKDKKRIIVLDRDLKDISQEDIKNFMKKVLGRHYENLKNRGAGWSFPSFQENLFKEWISNQSEPKVEHQSVVEIANPTTEQENTESTIETSTISDPPPCVLETDDIVKDIKPILVEVSTQTEEIPNKKEENTTYKFDIDPALQLFGKQWLMG